MQSDVSHFAAIALGTKLVAEGSVVDLFERGGHEFCDLNVHIFRQPDDAPVLSARHRAIYRLREV